MASQPTEALASLFDTTEDGLDDTLVNMELPDMIAKILGFSMTAGKMHWSPSIQMQRLCADILHPINLGKIESVLLTSPKD